MRKGVGSQKSGARRTLPDYLQRGLKLVIVGINPGERAVQSGHYYANPRNKFWEFLHNCGLTDHRLAPEEDTRVTEYGLGLTDRVKRSTKSGNELHAADFKQGAEDLRDRLERKGWPRILAFNGKIGLKWILGYSPGWGRQKNLFGRSEVWVLPATSPANAAIKLQEKFRYFEELARRVGETS